MHQFHFHEYSKEYTPGQHKLKTMFYNARALSDEKAIADFINEVRQNEDQSFPI